MNDKPLHLRLTGIEKSYPEPFSIAELPRIFSEKGKKRTRTVLRGIDLQIGIGERVGIIGQNGAGKSTLLKIIAGTAMPSAGEVDVKGKVHAVLTLGVGLREEYSGRENLYLEAEALGNSRLEIEPLIGDMIEFADLGEFIDKPVKTYSSGMKSRLVFSSLVFIEPEILMLDETLATGDQWFQAKARQAIHKLCDRGKIVIVVSHSMASIIDICSRCIWIKDGAIAEDGNPRDVVRKYEEYQRTRIEARNVTPVRTKRLVSSGADIEIDTVRFLQRGSEQVSGTVTSGLPLDIEVDLRGVAACLSPRISMTLRRADGLVLIQSEFDLGYDTAIPSISSAACKIEALPLSPGRYECILKIIADDGERAAVTKSLRVQSDNVPEGGTPLFLYPIKTEILS